MKASDLQLPKLSAFVAVVLALPIQANTLDRIATAVKDSTTKIKLRYRLESVNQQGASENALASTLKSRLTWQSASINHLNIEVQVDNVAYIGIDDFNSTANGKSEFPVVADPKGTDLNQVNIQYSGEKFTLIAGRQGLIHNNQRFIGGVAWRQNEQTYDAVRFKYKVTDSVSLDYSYVSKVNRIFGPTDGTQAANWHGNFHLANAKWVLGKHHIMSAFGYFLDNHDVAGASSNTFGVDYSGVFGRVTANFSYAVQSDAGDNPNNYQTDYYKAAVATKVEQVKIDAGFEVLANDNGIGFSTPLATLHKFQGFADKFLITPEMGIEDKYISVGARVGEVKLGATYHQFDSSESNIHYGNEIDLVASYQVNKHISGLLKAAVYNAKQHSRDTTKLWVMLSVAF